VIGSILTQFIVFTR